MAAFYGTIQGNRGMATRCGSPASGMSSSCQSWEGSIIVDANENEEGKVLFDIKTSEGSSCYGNTVLSNVTIEEFNQLMDYVRKHRNEILNNKLGNK